MKKTKLASAISLGSAVAVVGVAEAAPININASESNGVVNGVTSADNVFLNPGAADASLTITNSSIIMDESLGATGNDPNKPIRESVVSFGGVGTTGNLDLTIADSHIQSTTAAGANHGDGVYVRTDGQGTHAEVNISNTTVDVDKSDYVGTGTGSTTFNGNLLENFGGSLNATLNNVDTTLTLGTSTPNYGGAVSHTAYSGGTLTIDKNSTITTSGNAGTGILIHQAANNVIQPSGPLAYDSNYNFTLNNEANIDTSKGISGHGIYQLIQQGSTTINNAGNISSSGHAIKVNFGKEGPINVTVNNSGALTTTNGEGIQIWNSDSAAGSINDVNIKVHNTGDMNINGGSTEDGICVDLAHIGDTTTAHNQAIDIFNSGTINTGLNFPIASSTTTGHDAIAVTTSTGGIGDIKIENQGALNANHGSGIIANQNGIGALTVSNSGAISVTGQDLSNGSNSTGHALSLKLNNANNDQALTLNNTGDLSVNNAGSADVPKHAINIVNAGTGATTINNAGKITVTDAGNGIAGMVNVNGALNFNNSGAVNAAGGFSLTNTSDKVSNIVNSGDIQVNQSGFWGMDIRTRGAINVENSGNLTGGGIQISNVSTTPVATTVLNTGNIKTDDYAMYISGYGTTTVNNSGALDGRTGLYGRDDHITINNTGAINAKTDAIWAIGITGSTVLNNSGEINSELHGLHAQTNGQDVTLNNTGKVTMTSPTYSSTALLSQNFGATGNTNLTNSGEVSATTALEAYNGGSGAINVENSGKITATKAGIYAGHTGTGDLNINTKGNIDLTAATNANATNEEVAGIHAVAQQGKANVSVGAGTISATGDNAYGIYLSDSNLGNTSAFALNLEKGAIVDGTQALSAVRIAHSGDATFNIANGAQIKGGAKGAALHLQAQGANSVYTLNNAGDISSSVDNVLSTQDAATTSTLNINNTGTITGYLANEAGIKINFTNDSGNGLNLRNFDQASKVKGVSVSDFGGGAFTNTANGVVRLKAVDNAAGVSGANAITGSGIGNINSAGINHARLQNVAKFTNQGIISMTENQKAGDALAISNNGTGEFIGSNGILQSDIVIDGKAADGSFRGIADVLVLDNATQGQTRIALNAVKEAGLTSGLTEGEGIKIVDVKGTSAKNAFVLDKNLASGVYEYVFDRGMHSETQSFFLRNNERDANGNITRVFYSPVVGAYLGGQQAAANMFNNMSLLDRRADAINPDRTLWIRTNYGNTRAELFSGVQDLETKSTTLQMGLDVAKNAYGVAGVFAGYGNASSEVTSKATNSKSKADIRGYQVGVYASFLPEGDQMGPYVDSWAYYARYDNKLKGLNNEESKFDANGYGASIEAGYTLPVYGMSNGKNVIIEPHAQVTYSKVDNDNFTDVNGSTFANNESKGVSTRLGARVYTQAPDSAEGLNPFLEANWLHNGMDNAVDVNGTKASTKIGENVGEVKMGAQGKINENLSVWSHVGGQFGEEGYKNYNFQIGFGMRW